jgi:hypothetical protein
MGPSVALSMTDVHHASPETNWSDYPKEVGAAPAYRDSVIVNVKHLLKACGPRQLRPPRRRR